MKKVLLLLFVMLMSAFVFAGTAEENSAITWCELSVAEFDEDAREELGIFSTSDNLSCECWGGNVVYESDWIDSYCFDNEIGQMFQRREVKEKIRPSCDQIVQFTDTQIVSEEFCKKCDAPVITSPKFSLGCVGNFELFQTNVTAELYDEKVDFCNATQMTIIESKEISQCDNPVSSLANDEIVSSSLTGVIVLIIIISAMYYFRNN